VKTDTGCVVQNCDFSNNSAERSGGAIHAYGAKEINISDCIFQNNLALPDISEGESNPQGYGGAVFTKSSNINLDECSFNNNESYYGGGLYSSESTVSLDVCGFFDNTSYKHQQTNIGSILEMILMLGALDFSGFIQEWIEMGITKAYCPDNVVFPWDGWQLFGGDGGAMYAADTNLEMTNCEFSDNISEKSGGALYTIVSEDKVFPVEIKDTAFYNNYSQKGGAVTSFAKNAVFDGCTFLENEADAVGGGLYSLDNISIENSSFDSNHAPVGAGICASVIGNK